MAKRTIKVEKLGEPQPVPKESYEDWISIEHVLSKYTVPVVAEAIDRCDVQAIDATGRRILATDGDENDIYSKAFAKKHLASRTGESISEEYCDVENNPLETFGWTKNCLPDFENINPHLTTNQNHQPQKNTTVTWTKRSYEEFKKEFQQAKTYDAAAEIHGVTRQRYQQVFNKKKKDYEFGRP